MASIDLPPPTPPTTPPVDPLSDVFSDSRSPSPAFSNYDSPSRASSPIHTSAISARNRRATSPTLPPDLQRLRQTHNTEGYRAGITSSKPLRIQEGFDETYPLGARLGEKIGWVHSVLKWMETAFPDDGEVKKARERAERELSRDAVLSESWWDERMVWKWPVPEAEDEDGKEKVITLDEVVDAWPPWKEWRERVAVLAEKRGLKIENPWVGGGQVEAETHKAQ